MSLSRFNMILKFLRFDDKQTCNDRHERDKLAAFSEIWELFLTQCRTNYKIGMHATIDKQLVSFRGRCSFRIHIKDKPDKYGLKI